jgi:hypothetical protein
MDSYDDSDPYWVKEEQPRPPRLSEDELGVPADTFHTTREDYFFEIDPEQRPFHERSGTPRIESDLVDLPTDSEGFYIFEETNSFDVDNLSERHNSSLKAENDTMPPPPLNFHSKTQLLKAKKGGRLRPCRAAGLIALPLAIAATAMGLYNTAQIRVPQNRIGRYEVQYAMGV